MIVRKLESKGATGLYHDDITLCHELGYDWIMRAIEWSEYFIFWSTRVAPAQQYSQCSSTQLRNYLGCMAPALALNTAGAPPTASDIVAALNDGFFAPPQRGPWKAGGTLTPASPRHHDGDRVDMKGSALTRDSCAPRWAH